MFDLGDLKKFLYSQQVFTALRMTLGTVLPGIVLISIFNQPLAGIACVLGAFCIALIDTPAPLWHKRRHMLFSTLVISVISLLTILAMYHPIAMWLMIVGTCFLAGLGIFYSSYSMAMGIPAMLAMFTVIEGESIGINVWSYTTWIVVGSLWYTCFCLAICYLLRHQMAKRALAECLYATADYFKARGQFYIPNIPLAQCHQTLINTQVAVIEAQQAARNIILTDLFVGRRVVDNPECIRLFNLLTDVVDMHESVLAMHTNFDTLRSDFACTDALDFMRDLLHKAARQLNRVADGIVTAIPLSHHFNAKAELRALQYEIQLAKNVTSLSALQDTYTRGRTIANMMEKLVQDLQSTFNTTDIPTKVIEQKYYSEPPPLHQLSWSQPALRYALRLTFAMLLGVIIGKQLGAHSVWIVITTMMVLRPGFGLSQQRNKHRIIGSLLGCLAVPLLLWAVTKATPLFWILAGSFWLSFSFIRLNYLISVFFLTVAVLLLYHFIAPEAVLVGDRLIDTFIGTAIGAGAARYLFPSWEYQLLAPHVAAALRTTRQYAKVLFAPIFVGIDYRLARRDALVALTTLSASYRRMLEEPANKQVQAQEVGDLVMHCDMLVSEIATLAHTRAQQPEISQSPSFQSSALAIDAALAGTPITPETQSSTAILPELSAAQQSASHIQQICARLRLPGKRLCHPE